MIFSGFNITGSLGRSSDLETFLNRDTGHRIVAHSNNITDTKLYKSIDIAFDYTMKLDASIMLVIHMLLMIMDYQVVLIVEEP